MYGVTQRRMAKQHSQNRLTRDFYRQDTITVARQLLGQNLVFKTSEGEKRILQIVETEAYLGIDDPGCHTFQGRRTFRTETMYLDGGFTYIYFIYGMHFCFNIVTQNVGEPEAVLIRAGEPLVGDHPLVANGPAKLCKFMGFDKSQNAYDLCSGPIWVENSGISLLDDQIDSGPRIGIDYAGDASFWPLRFWWAGHRACSR